MRYAHKTENWERLNIFKKEYGVTIFFNTHYMDEAELYADEIAIINKGKK